MKVVHEGIIVDDGDTLVIIAKTKPSLADPNGYYGGVAAAYRVVASLGDITNPTLELVRVGPTVATRKNDVEERESL